MFKFKGSIRKAIIIIALLMLFPLLLTLTGYSAGTMIHKALQLSVLFSSR